MKPLQLHVGSGSLGILRAILHLQAVSLCLMGK